MDNCGDTLQGGGVVSMNEIIDTDNLDPVAICSVLALDEGDLL